MNVTGTDLLPVLTAARRSGHVRFRFFLQRHETFLDPPSTRFGTVRPDSPRLHPATCRNKPQSRQRRLNSDLMLQYDRLFPPTWLLLGRCISALFTSSPSLSSSNTTSSSRLLFISTLPDLARLPLDGLGTSPAPELRLQFDHTGSDGVSFTAGLVALRPLGPLGDHAVDGWEEERKEEDKSDKEPVTGRKTKDKYGAADGRRIVSRSTCRILLQ